LQDPVVKREDLPSVKVRLTNRSACSHDIEIKITDQFGKELSKQVVRDNKGGDKDLLFSVKKENLFVITLTNNHCDGNVGTVNFEQDNKTQARLLLDQCNTSGN